MRASALRTDFPAAPKAYKSDRNFAASLILRKPLSRRSFRLRGALRDVQVGAEIVRIQRRSVPVLPVRQFRSSATNLPRFNVNALLECGRIVRGDRILVVPVPGGCHGSDVQAVHVTLRR